MKCPKCKSETWFMYRGGDNIEICSNIACDYRKNHGKTVEEIEIDKDTGC